MSDVDAALHQFSESGWLLPEDERARLLQRFPPRYQDVVAHHVTLAPVGHPPPDASDAAIVGRADDGTGVEALVVRLAGSTGRPDGSAWHITWSLDRAAGRKAVESNAVIAERGWTALNRPIPVRLQPPAILAAPHEPGEGCEHRRMADRRESRASARRRFNRFSEV